MKILIIFSVIMCSVASARSETLYMDQAIDEGDAWATTICKASAIKRVPADERTRRFIIQSMEADAVNLGAKTPQEIEVFVSYAWAEYLARIKALIEVQRHE